MKKSYEVVGINQVNGKEERKSFSSKNERNKSLQDLISETQKNGLQWKVVTNDPYDVVTVLISK